VVARGSSRLLAILGILLTIDITTACARAIVDPAEPNAVLTLKNDLNVSVVLVPCEDSQCHKLAGSVRNSVASGDTLPVNVSTDGVPMYYRVVAGSGGTAGCLALVVNKTPEKRIVPLSAAIDCRSVPHSPPSQSMLSVIIGWSLFVLVATIGILTSAIVTIRVYRNLRTRGFARAIATFLGALMAVVSFLGLWTVVLAYWLLRAAVQLSRRISTRQM
jgi:hypothetical protein